MVTAESMYTHEFADAYALNRGPGYFGVNPLSEWRSPALRGWG